MNRKPVEETPLMKQYFSIKAKYPDALLLFRVGDFYETFGEDAIKTSRILGIVLTKRSNGSSNIELAGFPFHSLDTYLPKLVKSGHRVAVCEQLEDPKLAKKIVKRGITELVTPGTTVSEKIINHKENNYLSALHFGDNNIGIAFLDVSTGEFLVAEGDVDYIENLLNTFNPSEIIYSKAKQKQYQEYFPSKRYTFLLEDWLFSYDFASEKLLNHFNVKSFKGFGIESYRTGISAAGVIIHYLAENKYDYLNHITKISRIEKDKYIWLDKFTIRNLELLHPLHPEGKALIDIIDNTSTPMGSRLLKKWISLPLKDIQKINERLDIVEILLKDYETTEKITSVLSRTGDLERLISRAALRKINPREVKYIEKALQCIEEVRNLLKQSQKEQLALISDKLNPCPALQDKINKTLVDDPPVTPGKSELIRQGTDAELDELRSLKSSSKDYLVKLRENAIRETGITSLKIGFNNVFGYYLEVTNAHKDKVPQEWMRKQTLVSAERYITEELKVFEEKILTAEEKINEIEARIFNELVMEIAGYVSAIQQNAAELARLDCLCSYAHTAQNNKYVKPVVDAGLSIDIRDGRHPVIEKCLPVEEQYIPNDLYLNNKNQQIIILTGPNMSGKSAILRQTALIVLMAQCGSYVPASSAKIGYIDKLFTRVGASDNISLGESTFMVEMMETASILNNISERSLILLDEIGRGTSTYDGISIAWAITEFLHQNPYAPKTVFATHYHELNEISATLPRVRNFNVSVKEYKNKIIFLRKLQPGGSEHSFGIHVAQMAGVPPVIVKRASVILEELEKQRVNMKNEQAVSGTPVSIQLKLFDVSDPVHERIKNELNKIDINAITPIEGLMKLNYLKNLLKKEN